MRQVISKPLLVCSPPYMIRSCINRRVDDVRDIYQRAQKEELVVEGLREGTNLVAEE